MPTKRYAMGSTPGCGTVFQEAADGDWVKYSDHMAELNALQQDLTKCTATENAIEGWMEMLHPLSTKPLEVFFHESDVERMRQQGRKFMTVLVMRAPESE